MSGIARHAPFCCVSKAVIGVQFHVRRKLLFIDRFKSGAIESIFLSVFSLAISTHLFALHSYLISQHNRSIRLRRSVRLLCVLNVDLLIY